MLYGRGAESLVVDKLLSAALEQRSGALVVRGEAGIGKSALLRYAAERATGMGILRCTGIESESELPFAGVHQLLSPILEHLEVIPARQQAALRAAFGVGPTVTEDRFLVSLAVLNVLAEAAETQPVLCLIDDAQWLDGASADALTFAARRIHAEGIAMLLAARDDPMRRFPAAGVPDLRLVGLDSDASSVLLAERTSVPVADDVRARLLADTLGNPLGLAELAAALSDEQLRGRAPLPERLPVSAAVEQVFLDRVRRLPEDAQTVLLVAAVDDSGDVGAVLQAARVLGADAASLDEAERAELVSVDGATMSFRHPLVRSAVYRGATSERRRGIQVALAADLDTDSDRRAWLLAGAASGPDDGVADALDAAADRARHRSAHAAAAAAYERAATLTADPELRAARLTEAGDAAWRAGEPDRARPLLDRAAPLAVAPMLRARIEHLRGTIETSCGAPSAAYAMLVGASELAVGLDSAGAAHMLTLAGQIAWASGDLVRLRDVGERLAALPSDGGEPTPGAQTMMGLTSFLRGDGAAAAHLLREAAEHAETSGDPLSVLVAAAGAMFLGDDQRAIGLFNRAIRAGRGAAAAAMLPAMMAPLASLEAWTGRYAAAQANAAEGLKLAEDTGQLNPAAHLRAVLAWVAAVQGREQDCRDAASAALSHAIGVRLGPHAAIAGWALAVLDLGAGRRSDAFDRLAALTVAAPGESHLMVAVFATADLVEAAVRTERASDAQEAFGRLAAWAQHTKSAWANAVVARCRAVLAAAGDDQDAHFDEALRLHATAGRPFDTARTELLYGETLRRRRRRADARRHLRVAHETFEQLGATPWADQARVELLATGETARRRDVDTLKDLTPQELQIVRFVMQGETNRSIAGQLFLSPRTVDYHLHKVFTKLGVTSRHQLMRLPLPDVQ